MATTTLGRGAAVLLGLALSATACGSSSSTSGDDPGTTTEVGQSEDLGDEGEPVDGGTLVVGVYAETSGWNPVIDRWALSGGLMGSSILEPLATLDADGQAQPWLATAWTPNEDFTVWTIDLREGITFHDGAEFNAQAAKDNIDFIDTAALSGIAIGPLIDHTEVVDGDTIAIHLTTRWGAFPSSFLAGLSALQRSPASMLAEDKGSRHPIGTGPFVFESWEPDVGMTTTANPDYWREGEPHLDAMEFRVITDPSTRAAALETGDIHMMVTTVAEDANRLDEEYTVLRNWDTDPGILVANVRPEISGKPNPMSNVHARLAVAKAINRDEIAASVGEGVEIPSSFFSSESPWGQPAEENGYPDYDPAAAEEEVAAYLSETGEETLSFTILGHASPDLQTVLTLVEEQLEAVGMDVEVSIMEEASLINTVIGATYEVAYFTPYSSPDPDQNHYFWSKGTAPGEGGININFTGFWNDTTEDALRRGRESEDFDARKEAYTEIVLENNANATTFWMYYTPFSIVAAPEVKGLSAIGDVPWGNFNPKTWLGGLWLAQD